jgi:hypothetical protein
VKQPVWAGCHTLRPFSFSFPSYLHALLKNSWKQVVLEKHKSFYGSPPPSYCLHSLIANGHPCQTGRRNRRYRVEWVGEDPVHQDCWYRGVEGKESVGQVPAQKRSGEENPDPSPGSPHRRESFLHQNEHPETQNLVSFIQLKAHISRYLILYAPSPIELLGWIHEPDLCW